MALATPVFRPKQSARFAAQLNSPPLTWILHSVALRNGMIPGSRRCTSAPSDRKSSAPSLRIFRPVLIDSFLQTNLVMFQNPVPLALRFQQQFHHFPNCSLTTGRLRDVVRDRKQLRTGVGGGDRETYASHHHLSLIH